MNKSLHERNFHAVEKELSVFTCYRCKFSNSSILNQIIKSLTIYVGFVGLNFVNLKISRITGNQSMGNLFWLDQQLTSLSNPSSSTTQTSGIDNFPASIEVHESAMKNTLMTFVIPNQNIEHDLIELMTLKKKDIQSL